MLNRALPVLLLLAAGCDLAATDTSPTAPNTEVVQQASKAEREKLFTNQFEVEFSPEAAGAYAVADDGEHYRADAEGIVRIPGEGELCMDMTRTLKDGTRQPLFADEPCVGDPDGGGTTHADLGYTSAGDGAEEFSIRICRWVCKIGQGCYKLCTTIVWAPGVP